MLFSNSGGRYGALGITPGGAGANEMITSAGGAKAVSPEAGGVAPADKVCTSDQRLMYTNGAWHVRSPDDVACASVIQSEDVNYVLQSKQLIFVGPLPIDLRNTNGQITTLDNPAQIGTGWGDWLAGALDAQGQALVKAGHSLPRYQSNTPLLSLLPRVVGATVDYYDDGSPTGAPMTSNPILAACVAKYPGDVALMSAWDAAQQQAYATNKPLPPDPGFASDGDPTCQDLIATYTFAPVQPLSASGGHALNPIKAWFSTDSNGFRMTSVMYDGDPYTYSYYSFAQWIAALSPRFVQTGLWSLITPDFLKASNTTDFNRNADVPPLAKFQFPILPSNCVSPYREACVVDPSNAVCVSKNCVYQDWGMWISVSAAGQATSSIAANNGQWDTGLDAPSSYAMQIGFAPLPTENIFDDIIDAIEWVATEIGEGIFDLAQWLSGAICGMSPQQMQQMAAKVPPGYAQAAALAALEVRLNAQCGTAIDCSTAPAGTPSCNTTGVTPWWQQWYVIIPALALIGFALFTAFGSDKKK